jgi:hypothetical protein
VPVPQAFSVPEEQHEAAAVGTDAVEVLAAADVDVALSFSFVVAAVCDGYLLLLA